MYTTSTINYHSAGYGFVAKADGLTSLGGNFFAYLGVDFRYNINGVLTGIDGKEKINNVTNNGLTLNSLSFGLKLGIAATF